MLIFRRGIVGNGVQAGFKQSALPIIVGVETTCFRVFFQDEYFLTKTGETYTGGQS